ncbi:MAG: DRTGG domain-containing protein [Lentimicrobiaceae bacterium]|nr:DRTGG domain-containing protein [Lentimicrobiaceae bacterium]
MKVLEIVKLLEGKIVTSSQAMDRQIDAAFSSDLMSDVLTLNDFQNVALITGLANIQTIRTVEMAGIYFVILVRGKKASDEMIELAEENETIIIETAYSAFRTSALIYNSGVKSLY